MSARVSGGFSKTDGGRPDAPADGGTLGLNCVDHPMVVAAEGPGSGCGG